MYRGQRIPALQGLYLYADFVSTRLWALRYDADKGRVTANHPLKSAGLAVMSFGEDEQGEIYLLRAASNGEVIYRLEGTSSKPASR